MRKVGNRKRTTDNGYRQVYSKYQAQNRHNCPLRGPCHKSKDNRIVEINHKLRNYKENVRKNLLSDEGLRHRSKRPVDVEPVSGTIKQNKGYKRSLLRGTEKLEVEIGLLAISHNLAKATA